MTADKITTQSLHVMKFRCQIFVLIKREVKNSL